MRFCADLRKLTAESASIRSVCLRVQFTHAGETVRTLLINTQYLLFYQELHAVTAFWIDNRLRAQHLCVASPVSPNMAS